MENATSRLSRVLELMRKKISRKTSKRRLSWRRGLDKLRGRHQPANTEIRSSGNDNAAQGGTIPEKNNAVGRSSVGNLTPDPSLRPNEKTNADSSTISGRTIQPQNLNIHLPTPAAEDKNSESEKDPRSPTEHNNKRDSGYESQRSPDTIPSSTFREADLDQSRRRHSATKKYFSLPFSHVAPSRHGPDDCSKSQSPPKSEASVAKSPAASTTVTPRQALGGGEIPTIPEVPELYDPLRTKIAASGLVYHEPAESKSDCKTSSPATFSGAMAESKNCFKRYEESRQQLLVFADWYDDEACDQLSQSLTNAGVGPRKLRLGQGEEIHSFVITVQTETEITVEQQESVRSTFKSELEKATHIKENFTADLAFKEGLLTPERTVGPAERQEVQTLANRREDCEGIQPCNTAQYECHRMGDSISEPRLKGSGTLGPMVTLGDDSYYVVPWHIFDNTQEDAAGFPSTREWNTHFVPKNHPLTVVHPSAFDMSQSRQGQAQRGKPKTLGEVTYYSGRMYVSRSHNPARSLSGFRKIPQSKVNTDWALVRVADMPKHHANHCRFAPDGREPESLAENPAVEILADGDKMKDHARGLVVFSTGRSSGTRWGTVCLSPEKYEDPAGGDTTFEWFIVQPKHMTKNQWIAEGMGIRGDSGAGVITEDGSKLVGQIWGRNAYYQDQPEDRVVYFTTATDLFDDIHKVTNLVPKLAKPQVSPSSTFESQKTTSTAGSKQDKRSGGKKKRSDTIHEDGLAKNSMENQPQTPSRTAANSTRKPERSSAPGVVWEVAKIRSLWAALPRWDRGPMMSG